MDKAVIQVRRSSRSTKGRPSQDPGMDYSAAVKKIQVKSETKDSKGYALDKEKALSKKGKTCSLNTANSKCSSGNFVCQLNTAAYELYKEKLSLKFRELATKNRIDYEVSNRTDTQGCIVEIVMKIVPTTDKPYKSPFTVNCYNTTSKILVNGPGVDKFIQTHQLILDSLPEEKKLRQLNTHIQSQINAVNNSPHYTSNKRTANLSINEFRTQPAGPANAKDFTLSNRKTDKINIDQSCIMGTSNEDEGEEGDPLSTTADISINQCDNTLDIFSQMDFCHDADSPQIQDIGCEACGSDTAVKQDATTLQSVNVDASHSNCVNLYDQLVKSNFSTPCPSDDETLLKTVHPISSIPDKNRAPTKAKTGKSRKKADHEETCQQLDVAKAHIVTLEETVNSCKDTIRNLQLHMLSETKNYVLLPPTAAGTLQVPVSHTAVSLGQATVPNTATGLFQGLLTPTAAGLVQAPVIHTSAGLVQAPVLHTSGGLVQAPGLHTVAGLVQAPVLPTAAGLVQAPVLSTAAGLVHISAPVTATGEVPPVPGSSQQQLASLENDILKIRITHLEQQVQTIQLQRQPSNFQLPSGQPAPMYYPPNPAGPGIRLPQQYYQHVMPPPPPYLHVPWPGATFPQQYYQHMMPPPPPCTAGPGCALPQQNYQQFPPPPPMNFNINPISGMVQMHPNTFLGQQQQPGHGIGFSYPAAQHPVNVSRPRPSMGFRRSRFHAGRNNINRPPNIQRVHEDNISSDTQELHPQAHDIQQPDSIIDFNGTGDQSHIPKEGESEVCHSEECSNMSISQVKSLNHNSEQNVCQEESKKEQGDTSNLEATSLDGIDTQQCGKEDITSAMKDVHGCHTTDIQEIDVCCDQTNDHEQSFLGYGRAQTNFHQKGPASVSLTKHQ